MRKFATPFFVALLALAMTVATVKDAEARRWRGALGFGVASAIIGGAIIASNRRAYGYYGGYGGYGDPYYDYDYYGPRYSAYYGNYYDDYYYPRYYAPRRYYYGGYRVIRPYRRHARWGHHHRRHGRHARWRY